jgi:hypothetical protein
MIGAKHFRMLIQSDEQGPIVTVTHLPTNQTRSARPGVGESCHKVRRVLEQQIIATFFNDRDLVFNLIHSRENGKVHGTHRVIHLATQRTLESSDRNVAVLIDALLLELWQEGLLPLSPDANSDTATA